MFNFNKTPEIIDSGPFLFPDQNIELFIRRLDLIDPVFGGNKWYKLKYNILKAKEKGFSDILTFGGAFSNHIAAVARIGSLSGIHTTGVIRGDHTSINNTTLSRAILDGMNIIFCSREQYRNKLLPEFLNQILEQPDKYFVIPEGGSNIEGVEGAQEILREKDEKFNIITVSCGTGATAAGLILKLRPHQQLIGFSVLRDRGFLENEIRKWNSVSKTNNWKIEHDFHFGGYAKQNEELLKFIENFRSIYNIPIEPVYTGKMFFGLFQLIKSGKIRSGSKILAVHTGGLQYLI